MDQQEQARLMTRVAGEHERYPHPELDGERMRLHLAIHVVVEAQLLAGEPPEVQRTLARLTEGGGLDRHEAIHLMGDVASEEVVTCLAAGRRYDEERYVARLRALKAAKPDASSG